MDAHEINYSHDLLAAAAEALKARDGFKLEELKRIAEGWMQPENEAEAWVAIFDAIIEAAYDLEMYEAKSAA
jgi:hypothetical protein